MICNEIFDEFSFPSNEEVVDYATRIGIDPNREPHLLFLAREGLMKPLPDHWKPCFDLNTQTYYYYNTEDGKSQWSHPLDEHYQNLVREERKKRADNDDNKSTVIQLNDENKMAVKITEDEDQSTSFQLAADGAKFLKKSNSSSNLRSILRPSVDEHTDDSKKIVRFDLSMTNFVAAYENCDDDGPDEDEDDEHVYNKENKDDNQEEEEEEIEEEIGKIFAKTKQKSLKGSFEILNAKLLDISEAKNRLSASPVSFDDSESNTKVKMKGRFSISPVSLTDEKDDCLKLKTDKEVNLKIGKVLKKKMEEQDSNLKAKINLIEQEYEQKFLEIKTQKAQEFENRVNNLENQIENNYKKKCEEIYKKFEKYTDDSMNEGNFSPTIIKCEEILEKIFQEKQSLEERFFNLKEKYQKLKTKVKSSIENRKAKKLSTPLIIENDSDDNNLVKDVPNSGGVISCSSVENLRKQLKRLDDLEEQLPSIGYDDQAYKVQYPFKNDSLQQSNSNLSNELGFFRHRIHLERDCIRRAKISLKNQQKLFQQQQKEPVTKNNRKEQMNLEISLYRTRCLLGEKIIRLRHLEKSYAHLRTHTKDGSDESTLSDVSSCNSASSGFSSTEFNQNENNLVSSSQSKSPSQNSNQHNYTTVVAQTTAISSVPNEIMRTLEKLNREIHDIWDVLISQQSSNNHNIKKPFRHWFKSKLN